MLRRKALAALIVFSLALPLQAALIAAPAAAAPVPLALINGTQFAGTQYLIVTPLAYQSAMQSIADWKTQKGVPARVALLEDIEASYPGRDNAEKVHEFLQDVYYNGTARGLKYVLLGGGSALVPTRTLHVNGTAMGLGYDHDDVLSDVYFAGLTGDWDADHDGVYGEHGEEDWSAEVYVGRLPFNSALEAGFARDNLLSYEKAPFVGSWMQSAAAFAAVMSAPNVLNGSYNWFEGNALRSVWNTQAFLPSTMTLDLLADYYELDPGNYTTSQDRLNSPNIMATLNAGKSVVISATHGYVPTGRGIPEYRGTTGLTETYGDGFVSANASALVNFGMLSFGYFSSCFVGSYADPTLPTLARLVTQDNHGFIAMVAPTDATLRGEDDFNSLGIREGNWWQSENYWSNFFNGSDPFRPGPALYQGINDYTAHIVDTGRDTTWGGYSNQKAVYNLLGDPEVPIWTAIAQDLNLTLPAQVYTAESHFRATVRDTLARPVAGATVALQAPGVYAVGTTDAQGRVDIVVSPTATGSLRVTATAHNFIPIEASVPVITAPADLAISASNVTLPSPVLRTGATIEVNFTVRNVGQQAAGSADARVLATPPGGLAQVIEPAMALGPLPAGTRAQGSFNWTPTEDGLWTIDIIVDPGDVVAEFDELNNQASVPVFASSVDLSFAAGTVRLNPPGQVAPGGTIHASGTLDRVGLIPRSFLVGYQLLRGDGSVSSEGNAVVATTQSDFDLEVLAPEAGSLTLRLTADAGREIVEFDESNNEVEFAVRAGAGPAVFALPTIQVDEDAPPTRVITDLSAFVADPDTPFAELTVTASASDPQFRVWVDGLTLVVQPEAAWSGNGTVTVTAFDGRESGSAVTTFSVRGVDRPPVVEVPPTQYGEEGVPFTYQVHAFDPDGGILAYAVSDSVVGGLPIYDGRIAFVPADDMRGFRTLTIVVYDTGNHSVSVPLYLYVRPVNHLPELVDLGVFEVWRGTNATFHLAAVDADGDPVSFSSDSARAMVFPDGTLTIDKVQAAALPAGESVIPVNMSDGLGASSGFVRVRVVEASGGTAAYGADLSVTLTALIAVAAAGAAVLWVARRGRREKV